MSGKTRSASAALKTADSPKVEEISMEQLIKKFAVFEKRFDSLETKIDNNHINLSDHIGKKISELEIKLKTKLETLEILEENIKAKMEELKNLESIVQYTVDEQNRKLNCPSISNDIINRFDTMERRYNNNNVVVRGIPELPKENLEEYFNKISSTIGLTNTDVDANANIFRIHPKRNLKNNGNDNTVNNTSNTVIIKFSSIQYKSKFFKKYLAHRQLSVRAIGFNADSRIYINECLTKFNYNIFKAAYKLKKTGSVASVFTINGIVHIKITKDDDPLSIKYIEEIPKLLPAQHSDSDHHDYHTP